MAEANGASAAFSQVTSRRCMPRSCTVEGIPSPINLQGFEQRFEQRLVGTPTADRVPKNRPANLGDTGGTDRPPRLVERQALLLPFEAAMRDDPTGLPFDIIDDILVVHVQHDAFRQHLFPMA